MSITHENELDGLGQLRLLLAQGRTPQTPEILGFELVEVDEGYAVFDGVPEHPLDAQIGSGHGAYVATLLENACECAVHARLSSTQTYRTLEFKVSYHCAPRDASDRVRVEGRLLSFGERIAFAEAKLTDEQGRLCASGTSTVLLLNR